MLRRVRPGGELVRHGPLTVDLRTKKVTVHGAGRGADPQGVRHPGVPGARPGPGRRPAGDPRGGLGLALVRADQGARRARGRAAPQARRARADRDRLRPRVPARRGLDGRASDRRWPSGARHRCCWPAWRSRSACSPQPGPARLPRRHARRGRSTVASVAEECLGDGSDRRAAAPGRSAGLRRRGDLVAVYDAAGQRVAGAAVRCPASRPALLRCGPHRPATRSYPAAGAADCAVPPGAQRCRPARLGIGRAVPLDRAARPPARRAVGAGSALVSAGRAAGRGVHRHRAGPLGQPAAQRAGGGGAAASATATSRPGRPRPGRPAGGTQAGGELQPMAARLRGAGQRPPGDDGRRLAPAAHAAGGAAAAARPARPGLRRGQPRPSWPARRRRSPGCRGWSTGCSPSRARRTSQPPRARPGRGGDQRTGPRPGGPPPRRRRSTLSVVGAGAAHRAGWATATWSRSWTTCWPTRWRRCRPAAHHLTVRRRGRPQSPDRSSPTTGRGMSPQQQQAAFRRFASGYAGRHRARPGHRAPAGHRRRRHGGLPTRRAAG